MTNGIDGGKRLRHRVNLKRTLRMMRIQRLVLNLSEGAVDSISNYL